jgi:hypothetical protein
LIGFKSADLRLAADLLPVELAHFMGSAILKIARWRDDASIMDRMRG